MSRRHVHILVISLLLALCGATPLLAQPTNGVAFDDPLTKKEQTNPYNAKHQLDLNSAPKSELVKLPGIGDAYAEAIIKNRPYANKTQIKTKAGIPTDTYDKIAEMIVAKQGK